LRSSILRLNSLIAAFFSATRLVGLLPFVFIGFNGLFTELDLCRTKDSVCHPFNVTQDRLDFNTESGTVKSTVDGYAGE
jgi:hypothetical protein